jgi:probable F420-dependent oxidoreductase
MLGNPAGCRLVTTQCLPEKGPDVKLGIATPVVTNVAGAALTWEKDATIEDIGRIAETADRLGYHHLTCSEHIGIPSSEAPRRGSRYWDPLATFGYVSARTVQIRLVTMTLVLGYHHPLAIVKRYGTLDHVSGGRVILGVGVGSLKAEFDLLGAPFDDRGARGDDALRALRAALATNEPVYEGEYYSFGGLTVDPCALQPHMPIWIGGRTRRSLRRAVTLAEGWCPFNVSIATAAEWLQARELPAGFEVVLPADGPLDPVGEPALTEDTLQAIAAAGTTTLSARFIHHSLEHYLEQIHALAELHGRTF